MLRYAGIGHRSIDPSYTERARAIARHLGERGFVLRSGGATGADAAFASGADESAREIVLPWAGYNGVDGRGVGVLGSAQFRAASEEASRSHPGWARCRAGAKRLLARNAAIVLGKNLDAPVDAVVCIASVDVTSGGTRHAMRVAERHGIKVLNLCILSDEEVFAAIDDVLRKKGVLVEEAPQPGAVA